MVTEAEILQWQANPDSQLLECIKSGDVLLISKERQQTIIKRISDQHEQLASAAETIEKLQYQHSVLLSAMGHMTMACEGIVKQAPNAIRKFANLKLTDKKGNISWMAVMGIATGFMSGSKESRDLKALFLDIKNGFNQQHFSAINFHAVIEILKTNSDVDLAEYEHGIEEITKFLTKDG